MEDIGISGFIVKIVARSLEAMGVPPRRLYQAIGVEGEAELDGVVPASRVTRFLTTISEELDDDALGLTMAREIERAGFSPFAQAVWTGGNLADALTRSAHFYAIASTEVGILSFQKGPLAHLSLRTGLVGAYVAGITAYGRRGWVLTDMLLGWHFVRARASTNRRFRLHAAHVRHTGGTPAAYEAFFEAPVLFGQPVDELVYDAAFLALPVRAPSADNDPALAEAGRAPAALEGEPFIDRVRAAVARTLPVKDCTVTCLSRDLGMTERAFQEALGALGTTHREIVDDVRHRLAIDLVARDDVPMADVARQLGFARLPAFYRAFARWTGATPGKFRARATRGTEQ